MSDVIEEKFFASPKVPGSWAAPTFSDLFTSISTSGKKIKQRDYRTSGKVPVVDQGEDFIGGYTDDESAVIKVFDPIIVFGDHTRVFKFLRHDFAPGADGTKILEPCEALDRKYAFYACMAARFPDKGYSRHFSFLKKIKVPVAPLKEQQRIVEKIETLFARLDKGEEAVREVRQLLTRYRQSVLKSAVTGRLTADWRAHRAGQLKHGRDLLDRILTTRREQWKGRGNYKKPVEPNTSDLPDLPDGWIWASVDKILRAGLSNGRSVPDAEGEGFPVMRLTALKDGLIDLAERKEGRWTAEEAEPYLVEQGDILVSRGNGSKQLVGRGGLIADAVDPVAYPDTMIRIPISLGYLSPRWFVQLWNSPFMRSQIEKAAKTTAGIYKINQGDIRSFAVPLPPLDEQEEIANSVSDGHAKTVDLERWCDTELKRSASLRQSILKDAFAGKLVPQDPADEPASDLLARIKESAD